MLLRKARLDEPVKFVCFGILLGLVAHDSLANTNNSLIVASLFVFAKHLINHLILLYNHNNTKSVLARNLSK